MTREPSDSSSSSGSIALDSIAALPRLLIVEDNDELRRELVTFFVERGWRVEFARTLSAALRIASQLLPQVIVTELILPDVRGYFAAQYRAAVPSGVVVIALTRISPSIFDSARKAGFDEVLAKPISADALHHHIETALATRSSR
jgi:DNA-binding response OmpR family regulator